MKLSKSYIKTWLNRNGYKFYNRKQFWKYGGVCKKGNRLYRFRFKDNQVDISCPLEDFDRWANSTDYFGLELQKIINKEFP